jgi:hypothetical protein
MFFIFVDLLKNNHKLITQKLMLFTCQNLEDMNCCNIQMKRGTQNKSPMFLLFMDMKKKTKAWPWRKRQFFNRLMREKNGEVV